MKPLGVHFKQISMITYHEEESLSITSKVNLPLVEKIVKYLYHNPTSTSENIIRTEIKNTI